MILLLALAMPSQASLLKGPYLQNPTPTSQVVSFELDEARACEVYYGLDPALDHIASSAEARLHEVELTGLEPSQTYAYQVFCGPDSSPLSSFVTAPHEEEPFVLLVLGDTRTDSEAHAAVISRALDTVGYPDLYVNTGDLVEDGGDPDLWQTFFEVEDPLLQGTTLLPVSGNHDDYTNDSLYAQWFNLPQEDTGTEGYYALTWADTRIVVVDTEEDFVTGSDQHRWLELQLSAADADPAIRHILVFFHYPCYSSGAHGVFDTSDWQEPRTYLVPLFERYGVDAVFNGHDHHYERTDPSLTGGITYVVAGGGGAPGAPEDFVDGLDDVVGWLGMAPGQTVGEYLEENETVWSLLKSFGYAEDYEGGWWRAEAEVVKSFVVLEIGGGAIHGTAYTVDGDLLDEFDIGTWDEAASDDDGDAWTEEEGDCDDADASVHPGVTDDCDGVDNDCDGVDNGCDTGDTDAPEDTDPAEDTASNEVPPTGCGCDSSGGLPWVLTLIGLLALRRRRPLRAGGSTPS